MAAARKSIPKWMRDKEKVHAFASLCKENKSSTDIATEIGISSQYVVISVSHLRKSVEAGTLTDAETRYAKGLLRLWDSRTVGRNRSMRDQQVNALYEMLVNAPTAEEEGEEELPE